jgi:hypothetical protein
MLGYCITMTTFFYLWIFRFEHDTFVLVINFVNKQWEPCYIIVGLFETTHTSSSAMAT